MNSQTNGKPPKWFKDFCVHFEMFGGEFTKTMNALESQDIALDEKIKKQDAKIAVQDSVINALSHDRDRLQLDVDDLSQYTRRTNLLFHGLEESDDNEDTDKLVMEITNERLKLGITLDDIGRSHRLGKKTAGKKRPVIARFATYRKRKQVYDAKKNLKGSRIVITENLTKTRYNLYNECKQIFNQKNVWTLDGRIYVSTGVKLQDGRNERRVITNEYDLENLTRELNI